MKTSAIVIKLTYPILLLALLAAGAGIFWQRPGSPSEITPLRGYARALTLFSNLRGCRLRPCQSAPQRFQGLGLPTAVSRTRQADDD
jgi:hypothetical protein